MLTLITVALVLAGCRSAADEAVERDRSGHYRTTSQYQAMEREEFKAAMQAGYRDFNQQLEQLRMQAEQIGADAREEFFAHLEGITETRTRFEAELARLDSTLDEDWPERRDEVAELYEDLRERLREAYDEVVDEA